MQPGFLNAQNIKLVFSTVAISAHRFILAYVKVNVHHCLILKTEEIYFDNTLKNVIDITSVIIPKIELKIVLLEAS